MASEARIQSSLQIRKTSGNTVLLDYQSRPTAFIADVTGTKGPAPGAITVTEAGVDVDLSELTTPGLCRIANQDSTNYFIYGIWDGASFFPLGECLAGESYIIRLSRELSAEFATGTATAGPADNSLRLVAVGGSVNALVEAFEK